MTTTDKLYNILRHVLEWKHFDRVTGAIAILNPIALLPQLYTVATSDDVGGVSIGMFSLFFLIQCVFALVAIKGKNIGAFVGMALSALLSMTIIVLVVLKSV